MIVSRESLKRDVCELLVDFLPLVNRIFALYFKDNNEDVLALDHFYNSDDKKMYYDVNSFK